jgi:hypothetical protein
MRIARTRHARSAAAITICYCFDISAFARSTYPRRHYDRTHAERIFAREACPMNMQTPQWGRIADHHTALSPVVDRPDRRISFLRRLAAFIGRPRFEGRALRAIGELVRDFRVAQAANFREWLTPAARLRQFWPGADSLRDARSIAIYIHYSPVDAVSEMVLRQVREYRAQGFAIVFVSMCRNLASEDLARLRELTALVVLRRNFALDFGAWHDVMPLLGEAAPHATELLLVNDSVCGPLFSMSGLFEEFRAAGEGVFGLTENLAPRAHLQSYFLLVRGRAAVGDVMRFLRDMRLTAHKRMLIRRGEVRLSSWMRDRGHLVAARQGYESVEWIALEHARALRRLRTIFPRDLAARNRGTWLEVLRRFPTNPTHSFWYELVDCCGFPFVKTEVLARNPLRLADIEDWRRLAQPGQDDIERVIEEHLLSMSAPAAAP